MSYGKKTRVYRRLNRAFHLMRKRGLIAKANFSCCSNCGGYEITTLAEKMIDGGKPKDEIKGCCFYHAQDNEVIDEYLERGKYWKRFVPKFPKDALHLRYGDMHSSNHDVIGLSTREVGVIVCECLMEAGVGHRWDGNPGQTIRVDVISACEPWDQKIVDQETDFPPQLGFADDFKELGS